MSEPHMVVACVYKNGKDLESDIAWESGKIPKDNEAALHWYTVAADGGSEEALRELFDTYYFGTDFVPKNRARAESYLRRATQLEHEWAMLVSARWAEETNQQKARIRKMKTGSL